MINNMTTAQRVKFQQELHKESRELHNEWLRSYGFESRIARLSNSQKDAIVRIANKVRGGAKCAEVLC